MTKNKHENQRQYNEQKQATNKILYCWFKQKGCIDIVLLTLGQAMTRHGNVIISLHVCGSSHL
jgi:hypothetical protein